MDYRARAQRIGGFRDWLSEHKADLSVACILEGRDAPDLSERLLAEALLGRADAIGIYSTSDANLAVSNVLHNTQRIGDVVFIGHELTEQTRRLLVNGTMALTIDQNPECQARAALDVLLARFGYAEDMRFPKAQTMSCFRSMDLTMLDRRNWSDRLKTQIIDFSHGLAVPEM